MAFNPIQDQVAVANAALQLLVRDTMLAGTVWRDPVPAESFARKANDTVSIYLPAYAVANKRTLRGNNDRVRSVLHERKVDVSLTNDLQVDIALTDENQTLDVRSLTAGVIAPAVGAIVRAYDEELATLMAGATYANDVEWDVTDPYDSLVDARVHLDNASVPATGRFLVLGSQLFADLLKYKLLVTADTSGSTQTLRNGVVGSVAGFNVLTSAFLAPDEGYAYHQTAYALASRAPVVPEGVAWGNVQSGGGFSIRVMQHLAQNGAGDLQNIVYHDSWFGASVVTDNGFIDADGKFIPAVEPDDGPNADLLVRAVKLGVGSGSV